MNDEYDSKKWLAKALARVEDNKNKRVNVEEPEVKSRSYLEHISYAHVTFKLECDNNKTIEISAQKHELLQRFEYWDDVLQEWCLEDEVEFEDEFYLTESEKGSRFFESDIHNYFDFNYIDEVYNGIFEGSSGINYFEPMEISQEKWKNYKDRFPKITSKKQFRINYT